MEIQGNLIKAKEIANKNNILGRYIMDEIEKSCHEISCWKDEQLKQTREDAKSLYDEISDCIYRLVKSRLSKNGIGESNALQQLESIMVKTQQFLQTI